MDAVYETELTLPGKRRGKVRDIYEAPAGDAGEPPRLVIVATDRVSAFDVVLPTPLPGKGRLLTEIAARWLRWIEDEGLSKSHLVSTDAGELPGLTDQERASIQGRVTIGRRCSVIPIEFVVRGYLAGSGWKEYQSDGTVCGVGLPAGLQEGDRLPEPIFTPATKAEQGAHDENVTFERASEIAGVETMTALRDRSLAIYRAGAAYAEERGVIIADTKFEFGFPDGADPSNPEEAILIDEALTPDSSRFWPKEDWRPGQAQPSFDKQYVRDYLLGLVHQGQWDKQPPGPPLPDEIVHNTMDRYEEARRRLFGERA